jgi:hypothetical protein
VGGVPEIVGAIDTGGGTGAEAGAELVAESSPCETPTTSQALKATSARVHAAKLKTTRTLRELNFLSNIPTSVDRRFIV